MRLDQIPFASVSIFKHWIGPFLSLLLRGIQWPCPCILHRELHHLAFEEFSVEEENFMQLAAFLSALAVGQRVSQLADVICHAFSKLEEDCLD